MEAPILLKLPNGLTVIADPQPDDGSVGAALFMPCGSGTDPASKMGLANMTQEYLLQGAGSYDRRQMAFELDRYGLQYQTSLGRESGVWKMGSLPKHAERAIRLLGSLVIRPTFPESSLEKVRAAMLEQLAAVEDQPTQKLFMELGAKFFPHPLSQPPLGRKDMVESITRDDLLHHHRATYHAGGAVLALAGRFDWTALKPVVEEVWGALPSGAGPAFGGPSNQAQRYHVEQAGAQVQIGLAYTSVPARHADFWKSTTLVEVLSGGMSSRLFSEVREKRGLVYSVNASHVGMRHLGAWFCYAGTTPDKAAETLEVIRGEVELLRQGITADECKKAKVKLTSGFRVMGEVVMDRAADEADQWFLTGQPLSVDERIRHVESLTLEEINAYAKTLSVEATVLTLGPSTWSSPSRSATVPAGH